MLADESFSPGAQGCPRKSEEAADKKKEKKRKAKAEKYNKQKNNKKKTIPQNNNTITKHNADESVAIHKKFIPQRLAWDSLSLGEKKNNYGGMK